MKKYIRPLLFVLAAILVVLLLSSCAKNMDTPVENESKSFKVVDLCGDFYTVVDLQTGVMYAVSNGYYNRGTVTLLVNADGTPKLFPGFDAREG